VCGLTALQALLFWMVIMAVDVHDLHELEDLDVERTDGVDRPATRRKFLLAKSQDTDELQINAEKLAADADQLAQLGATVVQVLCGVDATYTEQEVNVLNSFANSLGITPPFVVGKNPPASENASPDLGGNMKTRARKDVEEAVDTEETEEEEVVAENEDENEEGEEEVTEKAQRSFKHPGGAGKKPPINDKTKQNTTGGPPKNTSGKMKTRKKTEETQDDETEETTDDLDARVASIVERALEDQLSPLLAKMEEFFTGQIAKSEGKRPVSKQANGQDRVTKSDPRNVGEGVFTNIVF
jgi:hypothetical protein